MRTVKNTITGLAFATAARVVIGLGLSYLTKKLIAKRVEKKIADDIEQYNGYCEMFSFHEYSFGAGPTFVLSDRQYNGYCKMLDGTRFETLVLDDHTIKVWVDDTVTADDIEQYNIVAGIVNKAMDKFGPIDAPYNRLQPLKK